MKKILFFLLLIPFLAEAQKPYAIRHVTPTQVDSFYQKFGTDSVFNESNVFVTMTAEWWMCCATSQLPAYFSNFVKRADGIYVNLNAINGFPSENVTIHADVSGNLALTNQANAEQSLANSQRGVVRFNTTGFVQARLTCIVMASSASANSPKIYFQYSTDGTNWNGNGNNGNGISLAATGAFESSWIDLPGGAIGDVYIRVAMSGGDGAADPALGTVTIQFR